MLKNTHLFFCLFLLSSSVAHTAIGGTFDTFAGNQINKNKWRYVEQGVEVLNNRLVLTKRTLSRNPDDNRSDLWTRFATIPAFTPDGDSSFQANMSVMVNYGSSETDQEAWAKIAGTFYQDTNIHADVVASVMIHHNAGDTIVTAEYNLMYMMGTYIGTGNDVAGGSGVFPYTGPLGEEVTAFISYNDATNTFTFRIAPASTYNPSDSNTYDEATVNPGHTTGAPSFAVRALSAENEVRTDQEVQVAGTFDDIFIDGSLFDDFSTTLLDPARWEQSTFGNTKLVTRRIDKNRLMIALQNNGTVRLRTETQFNSSQYFTNYIEAEFTISSDTVMTSYPATDPNPATWAQARLEAHLYSDTYSNGEPIDRVGQNSPRVNITVVNFDGTYGLYASARIYRCIDAGCDNETTWKHYMGCSLSLDTPIKVSLERNGNDLIFGCNSSYYTHTVPVMYDLPYNRRQIQGFVGSTGTDIGYLKFYADNVKIQKSTPWNLFLPAFINSSNN